MCACVCEKLTRCWRLMGARRSTDEVADWRRAGQIPALIEAFNWYEARLRTNNAVDFDDLLSLCVALLRDEVRFYSCETRFSRGRQRNVEQTQNGDCMTDGCCTWAHDAVATRRLS